MLTRQPLLAWESEWLQCISKWPSTTTEAKGLILWENPLTKTLYPLNTLGNHGLPGHFPAPSFRCMYLYTNVCVHAHVSPAPMSRERDSAEGRLGWSSTTRGPVINWFGVSIPVFQRLLVKHQQTWFKVQILRLTSCITWARSLTSQPQFPFT